MAGENFDVDLFRNGIATAQVRRWLTVGEVITILTPGPELVLNITKNAPTAQPKSGSLFLYNRTTTRNYKRDGYTWIRKQKANKIREDHVKLRYDGQYRVAGTYVHCATIPTMHRRSYHLIDQSGVSVRQKQESGAPSFVLVHYLDTNVAEALVSAASAPKADQIQAVERPLSIEPNLSEAIPHEATHQSVSSTPNNLNTSSTHPKDIQGRNPALAWDDSARSASGWWDGNRMRHFTHGVDQHSGNNLAIGNEWPQPNTGHIPPANYRRSDSYINSKPTGIHLNHSSGNWNSYSVYENSRHSPPTKRKTDGWSDEYDLDQSEVVEPRSKKRLSPHRIVESHGTSGSWNIDNHNQTINYPIPHENRSVYCIDGQVHTQKSTEYNSQQGRPPDYQHLPHQSGSPTTSRTRRQFQQSSLEYNEQNTLSGTAHGSPALPEVIDISPISLDIKATTSIVVTVSSPISVPEMVDQHGREWTLFAAFATCFSLEELALSEMKQLTPFTFKCSGPYYFQMDKNPPSFPFEMNVIILRGLKHSESHDSLFIENARSFLDQLRMDYWRNSVKIPCILTDGRVEVLTQISESNFILLDDRKQKDSKPIKDGTNIDGHVPFSWSS